MEIYTSLIELIKEDFSALTLIITAGFIFRRYWKPVMLYFKRQELVKLYSIKDKKGFLMYYVEYKALGGNSYIDDLKEKVDRWK